MCYRCATNPSIHHRCCHVAAVSLLLSHHGVAFTVTLSWFCHCHCDVAFVVTSSWCHHCSHVVVVPLLSHRHRFIITVVVSPLSSHCRGFVVAVVVSPSRLSQFHRCHHGVAFVSVVVSSSLSQCHLRCRIVMVSSSSWCCLHHCIVTVSLSQFHRRHCSVAFVVTSLWCRCRSRVVAVPLLSHRCGFVVAVTM